MRTAAVVCVLALAFVAFAAASVRAADVEMVEAELVEADHPALMEVVRSRRVRAGGIGDAVKKAAGAVKGKAKGKPKSKPLTGKPPTGKPLTGKPPKFNGNTGIAGGLPGASKVPGQGGAPKHYRGGGAKGGQKADKWNPDAQPKGGKGKGNGKPKDSKKYPKPGKDVKTIGGHGTGAFGGQDADNWKPPADEAINKGASKGGPIGGAFQTLFGHKMGEKPKADDKPKAFNGPLTGLPPQFRKHSGNTGIVPPHIGGGNTGIVPPGIGGN